MIFIFYEYECTEFFIKFGIYPFHGMKLNPVTKLDLLKNYPGFGYGQNET